MEIAWKVLENLRIVKFPKWKPFNRKFQKLGYAWRGGPLFYEKFRKLKPKFSVESKALIDTVDTITYYRKKKRSPLCRLFVCQFSAYCFGPFHTISWHWKGRSHFNLVCPLWLFPLWFHSDKSLRCVFESRRILIKKVNSVLAHWCTPPMPVSGLWATTGVSLLSCWMLQSDGPVLSRPHPTLHLFGYRARGSPATGDDRMLSGHLGRHSCESHTKLLKIIKKIPHERDDGIFKYAVVTYRIYPCVGISIDV